MKLISIQILLFTASINFLSSQTNNTLLNNESKTFYYFSDTTQLNDSTIYLKFHKVLGRDTILSSSHYAIVKGNSIILNGLTFTYTNNKVGVIANYELGKQEGLEIWYSKDCSYVKEHIQFKNNIIDGSYICYYPNGKIKQFGNCYYSRTAKYGRWINFYENGNIKSEGTYGLYDLRGKLEEQNVQVNQIKMDDFYNFVTVKLGKWIYYDTSGKIVKEEFISPPQLVLKNGDD